MKASMRHIIDAVALRAHRQQAARTASLSHELHTLAAVLAGPMRAGDKQGADARRRQRIHVALLEQNGLIDADGRPVGWTVEEDIREELLAVSELSAMRRVS